MRLKFLSLLFLTLMAVAGCGSNAATSHPTGATLQAVYGSSLDGVTLSQAHDRVSLSISRLPAAGKMLRVSLPVGIQPGTASWSGDSATLHLIAPVLGGADIGVVPTAAYHGEAVSVELALKAADRQASVPPVGPQNVITDLTVTPAGTGLVDLDWTQVNVGDYNFDGEVNISDLTPLAINLGKTVDRAQPGAKQLTEYWVDGDSNGEVNIADLTPIAAHYQDQVVGYNIHQNGALLPGSPTVPSSQATKRTHLPNLFHVELSGQQSDTWVVAPVDQNGIEGADSSGNIGPVDLQTSVNIGGLNLYDLNTGQPGPFSPGKVSSRVIDPGDIVDRAQIGTVTMNGTSASIRNLPRNKVYIVDFRYAPTVNLSTGAPKGGSSIKGTSAVSDSDIVNTSVIFELPDGTDPADIHADITAEANPSGGYYIDLLATLNIPGDNPDTPAIETSYMEQEHSRLDCAAGTIAQDSDNDGIFDDNPELADPDHDCLSENEIARYEDLHGYRRDDGEETEVVATIQSVDLAAGMLNLSGIATNPEGSAAPYVGPSTDSIAFTELTQFLERTNANPDGVIVDPTTFTAGQSVEVEMYPVKDASGNVLHYWIEKVKLDLRTGGGGGGGGGKGGGGDG